jgi:hypothetical protein
MKIIEKIQGCTNKDGCFQEVAIINTEITEIWCSLCEEFGPLTLFKFPPHPALQRRGLRFFYGCQDWRCVSSDHWAFTPLEKKKLLQMTRGNEPSKEDIKIFKNFFKMTFTKPDVPFGEVWLYAMHQQGRRREKSNDESCPICLDTIQENFTKRFPCSHAVCLECARRTEVKLMKSCPMCRVPFVFNDEYEQILASE